MDIKYKRSKWSSSLGSVQVLPEERVVGDADFALCPMLIGTVLTLVYSQVFSFSSAEFIPSFSFCSVPLLKVLSFFCPVLQMILLALSLTTYKEFDGQFSKI